VTGPESTRSAWEGKLVKVVLERWGEREVEIVEHPGSVVVLPVDRDGRVVLVRQFRFPARAPLLELPAGKLEPGEEPLASAKRELAEECGLRGGEWSLLARFWSSPGFLREEMHLYLAEGVEEGDPELDEDEQIELVRWPVAQLESRLGEVEDAKTLIGLLRYLERPPR
jgi:ADP-ribose pyrophosphatase